MQAPRIDALSAFEKDEILATARDLLDDPQIRTSVTYRAMGAASYNVNTGVQARNDTSTSINAISRLVTAEEVARGGGTLQAGDRMYLVDAADISEPNKSDEIDDGDQVWTVRQWKIDALGHFYHITARRA